MIDYKREIALLLMTRHVLRAKNIVFELFSLNGSSQYHKHLKSKTTRNHLHAVARFYYPAEKRKTNL